MEIIWGNVSFHSSIEAIDHCFYSGCFYRFSSRYCFAGFLLSGGNVFMHENLGPPVPPDEKRKNYFGFIPGLSFGGLGIGFGIICGLFFLEKFWLSARDLKTVWSTSGHTRHLVLKSLIMALISNDFPLAPK